MKASIIIPTYNETNDLEVTIAMAAASDPPPHEIIVIDDCSDVPVTQRLGSFPNVRVHRTESRIGAGPAKRLGGNLATGDVVIILDSHMRMPMDWLELIDKAITAHPRSIFSTTCRGFETFGQFIGCGANLTREGTNFLWPVWKVRGDYNAVDTCPLIYGACYIIPKTIWDDLQGLNPNFFGWGYEEVDLSLRAWLFGYECRRINGLVVPHKFKRKVEGYRLNGWEAEYNYLVCAYTLFEEPTFNRLVLPYFDAVANPMAAELFDGNKPAIDEFRNFVQMRRMISDEDLMALCGFRIPSKEEQDVAHQTKLTINPALGQEHRRRILHALPPNGSMLEWGCGDSTLLFRHALKEGQSLLSIEHNKLWAARIGGNVVLHETHSQIGVIEEEQRNGHVLLDTTDPYVAAGELGLFDVILVDGIFRNACLRRIAEGGLLKKGGTIFLHDAQRDWYEVGKSYGGLIWLEELSSCDDYVGPTMLVGRLND